ncbi:MAG: hypothetical protein HZA62_01445 [Rhodocyclales bacterium]|nr:hypothetical protein [Rhodocyclales bacterium]
MKPWIALFATLASCTALASPPPGHPSPAQARELLMPDRPSTPEDLPNQGRVLSSIDANEFTYIEVAREDGGREWIAAPKVALKVGSRIRYEAGSVMTDFYSKLLMRSFPSVMFVGHVTVVE